MSSDGTTKWLEAQTDIAARSEIDLGMYDGINRAWSRASGDFYAWLNSDEQYLPGTLKFVADFFDDNPNVDIVFGDYIVTDRQGFPIAARREIPFRRMYVVNGFLNTSSCTLFFRRNLYDRGLLILNSHYRYAADTEMMLRLHSAGSTICRLPKYLSLFGVDGKNLSAQDAAGRENLEVHTAAGAARWPLVRKLLLLGRHFERLVSGAYRVTSLRYMYAMDETPNYVEIEADVVGGRYSLVDKNGLS